MPVLILQENGTQLRSASLNPSWVTISFWEMLSDHLEDESRFPEENTMQKNTLAFTLAAAVALSITVTAEEQEKKIKRTDLPPAVEKTVVEQSKGATIRGFNEEKENGETSYEVEMMMNGHSKDVQIDPSGTVIEVEEQVAMDALPAAVKDGLQAKAGAGKLTKVESITKKDRLVAYEAQVLTGAKKSEVQVGPDGRPLDHEE